MINFAAVKTISGLLLFWTLKKLLTLWIDLLDRDLLIFDAKPKLKCLEGLCLKTNSKSQKLFTNINHKNYNYREKKNSQVMKERKKFALSLWNWLQSKWVCWLLSDERKTSLMSIKNATMHEKLGTIWLPNGAVFPAKSKCF